MAAPVCDTSAPGTPEGDTLISVRDLEMGYGERIILTGVNFDVRQGEVFVILGGSGCGKSTLLKHMIGLYAPRRGQILIRGRDITTAEGEDKRAIMREFGVMFQTGALFGSMTLAENVGLPLTEFTDLPPDAIAAVVDLKLGLVGLAAFREHMPSELSGGMQKRAAIARAMALDPGIIFLDEPSAGLDPITSAELDQLIIRLSRELGMTFVVVTHELPSIFAIADRVILLDREARGGIAQGPPAELRDHSEDPRVKRFFNRESH